MQTHLIRAMLATLVVMLIAGCAGAAPTAQQPTAVADPNAIKVAMLLPGKANDKGWSQSGYEGLQLVANEDKVGIAYKEDVTTEQAADLMRDYAKQGYDLVIGHGGEYIEAAETVAKEFPDTQFALIAGHPGNNDNLGSLGFHEDEIGYMTGVVAALKSKTKHVAFLGGFAYPHVEDQARGFQAGVESVDPTIKTTISWLDSWSDEAKGRAALESAADAGADVFVVDADVAGLGAIKAAQERKLYAIGWSVDQHSLAPDTILTSAVQRVPILLREGIHLVEQGRWEGRRYLFGVREGAQDLAPFYDMLTEEEVARVEQARQDLLNGKVDLER